VTSGLTTLPLPEPAHRLLYSYKHLPNNISTFFQWRAQTAVFISVDSPRSRLICAGTHLGREIWLERTRICVYLPLPMVGTSSTPGYCSKRWGVDPPSPVGVSQNEASAGIGFHVLWRNTYRAWGVYSPTLRTVTGRTGGSYHRKG
jgi:hypothetical protein